MGHDVLIVGAGLVGASLARALAGSGLALGVIEPAPPPQPGADWDARVYALSPRTVSFLGTLGAWRELDAERIAPVYAMRVFGDDGRSRLDFSAYEAGIDALAYIVESGRLQQVLWRGLERQDQLRLLCPARPDELALREDGATLRLQGGEAVTARLIVGADGAGSWLRKSGGFVTHARGYGQQGVVANFSCERAHRNVAYQWFRRDGVLAYLPLPGNRVSIVWSTPDAHAQELLALPAAEFCARVARAGNEVLGELAPVTPPAAFPLNRISVKSMVASRLALIGDAAHVIHPLAGQGVNLGFGDARALARELLDRVPGCDVGDASLLRRFERARAEDILAMRFVTDGLARLFSSSIPGVAGVRNFGLNLTNAVPVIRTWLVRQAAG